MSLPSAELARALGGRGDRFGHQLGQTHRLVVLVSSSAGISTSSAALVVPPGLVTAWRSCAGVVSLSIQQGAGAGNGLTRQAHRQISLEAEPLAGRRSSPRPGGTHKPGPPPESAVTACMSSSLAEPDRLAHGRHQLVGLAALGFARSVVGEESGDAAADGRRRVGHRPDDWHVRAERLLEGTDRLAGGDRDDEAGRAQPLAEIVQHELASAAA